MAHYVLDLDNGIIHQHTRDQRQSQQADGVEGEIHRLHEGEGGNRREWNRQSRDQGGAHIAQEKPHHQDRQYRAFHEGAQSGVIGLLGVVDTVEDHFELDLGILLLDLGELLLDRRQYRDVGEPFRLVDSESRCLTAVPTRDRADFSHTILDRGNVAQAGKAVAR